MQDKTKWCWAACTQALLKAKNVLKDQKEIVEYVTNKKVTPNDDLNVSGDVNGIAKALNNFLEVDTYKGYIGSAKTYSTMVSKIKNDKLVILAGEQTTGSKTSFHAMVCYGYNSNDPNNLKLYVKSPTPDGASNYTLICSSDKATSYDVYDSNNNKIGTYTVTGYAADTAN